MIGESQSSGFANGLNRELLVLGSLWKTPNQDGTSSFQFLVLLPHLSMSLQNGGGWYMPAFSEIPGIFLDFGKFPLAIPKERLLLKT